MDFINFFEPVRIGSNINLLRRATVLETYTTPNNSETGRVCSICQNNYENGDIVRKINHCSHFYHHICLDQWLENNTKCPECQFDLREDNHQNAENTSRTNANSSATGIPTSFNHPFNHPINNHNNHHNNNHNGNSFQRNPYLQIALQQRINDILRSRINNDPSTIPNVFTIPIFQQERQEHESHQDILNEINQMRNMLNNAIINSVNNSSQPRQQSSQQTSSQQQPSPQQPSPQQPSPQQPSHQRIPTNIQNIINSLSNSISSDTTENPTIEVEYYYQNDNSPTIQRITQQIQRPPTETTNRPPPSLNIEIESDDNLNDESEQEVRLVSIKDNNAKKEKKYKKKIKTEYIYSSSEESDNSDDEKESPPLRKESIKESLREINQKFITLEQKLLNNNNIKTFEINENNENNKNNSKTRKCSLFSCWRK
jgi:hypothetical protein